MGSEMCIRDSLYGAVSSDWHQIKQVRATADEDRAAMLEIVQSKAEELLRREEEGKTMRLLYESEVGTVDATHRRYHR